MKIFNSVAALKEARLPANGQRVARYYYTKGDAGYADGVVKTAAQAASDGEVIDGYYNVALANGNVWIGEKEPKINIRKFGATDGDKIATTNAIELAVAHAVNTHAGTVDFAAVDSEVDVMVFSGLLNVDFWGNGAKLRKVSPAASDIFQFKDGCQDIDIYGFDDLDGDYDSTNLTTGGNPVIMIGDPTDSAGFGLTNKNIRVFYNNIRRSNWAAVVIYARSNNAETVKPSSNNIKVFHNVITDCGGNGVFVYKNAATVHIYGNLMDGLANDGVIFDTQAESDSVGTEIIQDAHVYDNRINNFGKVGFGVGVLVKGDVRGYTVTNNNITNGMVQDAPSLTNYGILITRDFSLARASNGDINKNKIRNIKGSTGGVGIAILSVDNATLDGNDVDDTSLEAYIVAGGSQFTKVINNNGKNAGSGRYGFSLVGTSGNEINDLTIIGNTYEKGAGTSSGGFRLDYIIEGRVYANAAPDFTTTALFVTNIVETMYQAEQKSIGIPTAGKLHVSGDLQWELAPSLSNPVVARICVLAGDPGIWRPCQWLTYNSTTANRPSLGTQDIGVTYLDTTLAPNGKPITWNGLAWVDSDGNSV